MRPIKTSPIRGRITIPLYLITDTSIRVACSVGIAVGCEITGGIVWIPPSIMYRHVPTLPCCRRPLFYMLLRFLPYRPTVSYLIMSRKLNCWRLWPWLLRTRLLGIVGFGRELLVRCLSCHFNVLVYQSL